MKPKISFVRSSKSINCYLHWLKNKITVTKMKNGDWKRPWLQKLHKLKSHKGMLL